VGALISVLATDPEELRRHDGAAASLRRAGAGNIVIDRLHDSSASSPDRRPADAIETIYATAVDVLRYASRQAHTDIPVEMESVSKVVSDLVDAIILDQGTALGLVAIKGRDEYTFTHTLHTCILCLELGYAMGLSRDDLRSLGSCGLLHDIGKVFVPLSILRKSSPLDPDEFATIQEHPVHGALVLSRQDSAPSVAPLVAFEHHLHCDFSGYPVISRPRALNFYSLMVGLADVYDAMTTDRPYRAAMTPQQALEAMYQQAGHFEPRLLDAFAAMLGEYPVGSLLRLSDGRLAVVTHPHASHVSRPLVRIVEREEGVARLADDETDLSALDPSGRGFLLNVDSPADPESEGIDVCVLLGGNPYFAE
jgi:HD-GYP domain-containing protein (c-di-GMP phosphodiesterase class II)